MTNPAQAADLLAYLRAAGCIAYRSEDPLVVQALSPRAARDEEAHVGELVSLWEAAVPGRTAS